MRIVVWTTQSCVQCRQTKMLMDRLGIRYDEMALEQHPDKVQEFKEKGFLAAPIVETDRKIWSGFRYEKIQSLARHLFSEKARLD